MMSAIPTSIGESYKGSVIVDIKEERKEMGSKIRNRKYVTLENGFILVEDVLEDIIKMKDIQGDYVELPYNEVEFPDKSIMSPYDPDAVKEKKVKKIKSPKPINLLDSDSEEDEREREEKWQAEKLRRQQEEEQVKEARLEEARQLKEQVVQKKREAEEEAARIKALKEEEARLLKELEEKYRPQPVIAYSSLDPDIPQGGGSIHALWQTASQTHLYPDQDCWQPQDLLLYAPGKEIPEEDSYHRHQVSGVWGYAPGSIMPSEDDDADFPDGWRPTGNVIVYPPGTTPPHSEDDSLHYGMYTYSSSSSPDIIKDSNVRRSQQQLWPPPIDEMKKLKKGLPTEFKPLKPIPVTVESAQNVATREQTGGSADSNNVDAVWAYPEGKERVDDKFWNPQPVLLHPPTGDVDDVSTTSTDSSSTSQPRVQGIWGFAPGCEPDPQTGQWEEKNVLIFPPETDPKDCPVKPQGKWEYDIDRSTETGGSTNIDSTSIQNSSFPPPYREPKDGNWKPQIATVYPKSKCPNSNSTSSSSSWKPRGIWKYTDHPLKDNKWRPQELLTYATNHLNDHIIDETKPYGRWGLSLDAKPDENGNWNPNDIWFYPPNEEPPSSSDSWRPQGIWMYPPQKLDVHWPPPSTRSFDEVGYKPKDHQSDEDWNTPQRCYVGQMKSVFENNVTSSDSISPDVIHPKGKTPLGVWKKSQNDDSWMSKTIVMYPGKEPKEPNDDINNRQRGEWGLSPDAEPNETTGEWDPSDIWFVHPDDKSPNADEWIPAGEWIVANDEEPIFDWKRQTVAVGSKQANAKGVWKFGSGSNGYDDDEDDEWRPTQVCMFPPGEKPDSIDDAKAHGVWGIAPGAEPDDDDEWNPSDIWFIGPDETPPKDWIEQGIWTSDERKPPEPKFIPNGEMSPIQWERRDVTVGSKQDAPAGVWKFGTGSKADDDDGDDEWRPSQVCMYPPGEEPENTDTKARGVWGLAPNAEPDEDGEWKPSDVWFFGPGETPPDDKDWMPHGVWTTNEEKPKKKAKKKSISDSSKKKKKASSTKKKPEKSTDTEPKKKGSYLNKNWKEEKATFGTIIRTSYTCDYSGGTGDALLSPPTVEKEKFEWKSPSSKRSPKDDVDKVDM